MYRKDLETIPGAKALHDATQRALAAERLKRVSSLKSERKAAKERSK